MFRESRGCDVITYNGLIAGLVRWERDEGALMVFKELIREALLRATEMTYISVLSACSLKEIGEQVYGQVIKIGLEDSMLVGNVAVTMYSVKNGSIMFTGVCNALISAYGKCEEIYSACQIFDEMSFKNLIPWNSIISGSILNGFPVQGLQSFCNLLNSGIEPNSYTLSTVLSTCATMSTLRLRAQIHSYILKSGSGCETALGNSLITMYAKCGDLDSSSKVFSGMLQRDVVSWNARIAA